MDLQKILETKVESLQAGPHSDGFRAVRIHIDAAVRHLKRGQADDETAFTDAIYRCNQAFEGSLKEAFRVLAGKDPAKKSIAQIEEFLTSGGVLRTKVLNQLTNYRTAWRNPSTHQYTLDFDEDEALLAIVSVTAFAIVLCDQVVGKLAYDAAEAVGKTVPRNEKFGSLLEQVSKLLIRFGSNVDYKASPRGSAFSEYEVHGAMAGFLAAELDAGADIRVEEITDDGSLIDILVTSSNEQVGVELRLSRHKSPLNAQMDSGLRYASIVKRDAGVSGVVLMMLSPEKTSYETIELKQDFVAVAPQAWQNRLRERADLLS
ncbi:MAG: hypothetical protein EOP84_31215 [Verrucomicrobiaceae bacterium]|nr:MAG: hypothetical protein EOP84_31215 [Verrucomicrobiaceae bacterium]